MSERMQQIGELIRTQDNRITDAPMFIVQEKKREYGYDPDYSDDSVWLDSENEYREATEAQSIWLDSLAETTSGWVKTGYKDRWEFVTACFTEQGCKDFIAADGHNHCELRIYADGSYRNAEFRAVREYLMSGVSESAHCPVCDLIIRAGQTCGCGK